MYQQNKLFGYHHLHNFVEQKLELQILVRQVLIGEPMD